MADPLNFKYVRTKHIAPVSTTSDLHGKLQAENEFPLIKQSLIVKCIILIKASYVVIAIPQFFIFWFLIIIVMPN